MIPIHYRTLDVTLGNMKRHGGLLQVGNPGRRKRLEQVIGFN
jgi:hypothetical protein